jgi:Calx-beta domain/RTX calcium-binding nonapeptide repeat (4 copies)
MLNTLLQRVTTCFQGTKRSHGLSRRRVSRLSGRGSAVIEDLEKRTLLAAFVWTGSGNGTSWSDPDNWAGGTAGQVPGLTDGQSDSAAIDIAANVILDVNIVQNATGDPLQSLSINHASANLTATGRTLTVDGASSIVAGTVTWVASTWTGDATSSLTNTGSIIVRGSSTVSTDSFVQNGSLTINGANSGGSATLTSPNGFTNAGLITLESLSSTSSNLTVTSGTLTNTGTLDVLTGSGGSRTINADILNTGVINLDTTTNFSKSSGVLTNNTGGSIDVATGTTLAVTGGSNYVFNMNDGSLDINGAFTMSVDTFNFDGGTVTGVPRLTASTLNLAAGSTASTFQLLGSSRLTGDVKATQTLQVNGSTSSGAATLTSPNGFTNAGLITLESLSSTSSNLTVTSGTLTNTGTLDVLTGSGGSRTINADILNTGVINLDTTTNFSKSSGVLTNNTGGSIDVATGTTLAVTGGSNYVFNMNDGSLDINGAFTMSVDTFNFDGGTVTGVPRLTASTLNLAAGSTASTFQLLGSSRLTGDVKATQTLQVNGSTSSGAATLTSPNGFTNAGLITLESLSSTSSNLTVTSGTLTNTGTLDVLTGSGGSRTINADILNTGVINLDTTTNFSKSSGVLTNNTGGSIDVATGTTLAVTGGSNYVFNMNDGSLDINGAFTMSVDTFNFDGGTVTGVPRLTASTLNLAAGSTASTFQLLGSSRLTGDVKATQTLQVNGSTSSGAATLTSPNGFTNAGLITLESLSSTSSNLTVTSGTLTNTGTLDVLTGSGGSRTINADILNTGVINLDTTTNFSKSSGVLTNNTGGSIDVATGTTLAVTGGSNYVFNMNDGSLDINGAFTMSVDTFNFDGGTVTGVPRLTASTLNLAAGSTASTFQLLGSSRLTGDVKATQTLQVNGSTSSGAATLTSPNGFTNAGLITLESLSSTSSNLTVTSGTLTNTGTLDVLTGSGGSRTINADILNTGVINLDTTTNFSKSSGVLTNNTGGSIDVATGTTLAVTGGSNYVFNMNDGSLDINGAFTMSVDTFNFNGGDITGGGTATLTASTVSAVGTAAAGFALPSANVSIGSSPGILDVISDPVSGSGGNWTHSTATRLNMEIGGSIPGSGFDQLNVEAVADLSGILDITFINGFAPHGCETFEIITFASRIGSTPTVNVSGLPAGFDARVDFDTDSATVVVFNTASRINVHPDSTTVSEDGVTATYEICLAASVAPTDVVTVNISPDGQLSTSSTTITFDPTTNWNLPQIITVSAVDDNVVEGLHTGVISHSSSSADSNYDNVTIPQVTASIVDNDSATVTFASAASSTTEGDGIHNIDVLLTIPGGGTLGDAVDVTVADLLTGTASVANDYSLTAASLTFPAGSSDGTLLSANLRSVQDSRVEGDEHVDLELQNLSGPATVSLGGQATHQSIVNDDDFATLSFATADSTIDESIGTHLVGVDLMISSVPSGGTLDRAISIDVVDLLTGSANTPSDYSFATQTVTFGAGSTGGTQTVAVTVIDDAVLEAPETVAMDLDIGSWTDPTNGQISIGAPDDHVVTITDNDAAAVVVDDVSVVEGTGLVFTVTLTAATTAFDVNVSFTDVDATGGTSSPDDYDNSGVTLTFAGTAGEQHQFVVATFDDPVVERHESFGVTLSATSTLVDDSDTGTGTIRNVDTAQLVVNGTADIEENGPFNLQVRLSAPVAEPVTFDLSTLDIGDAAGGGIDYDDIAGHSLSFAALATAPLTVSVLINDDNIVEFDEAFEARLSNLTSALSAFVSIGPNATSTIQNTDLATFTISDTVVSEGDGVATFTISLDNPLATDVSLDVNYLDVSATGSSGGVAADFDNDQDSVTFPAGDTASRTVQVSITDDNLIESTETYTALMSTTATLNVDTTDSGTGTITDNDLPTENDPPQITSLTSSSESCGTAAHGTPVSITGVFTDLDDQDTHTAVIDWGDGRRTTGLVNETARTITGEHIYDDGGIYTITVTLSDGVDSDTEATTAYVVGVRLTPEGVLQIVGTNGKDIVNVLRVGSRNNSRIKVIARFNVGRHHGHRHGHGVETFYYDQSDVRSVHMELCDGNDRGIVSSGWHSSISIPTFIDGGAGHDVLVGGNGDDVILGNTGHDLIIGQGGDDLLDGGSGCDIVIGNRGNDILLGGDGRDLLLGGSGRDVLIGGLGRDWLLGGRDDDIMIGARTTLDHDQLKDVRTIWAGPGRYSARVAALTGTGDLLEANVNVLDDHESDTLRGQQGRDLFFANLAGPGKDHVQGRSLFEDLLSLF